MTVFGTTRCAKDKVCVFIGGGGSTEIAIYDKEIKESVNTKIGVIDVMQEFPDLAENFATTNLETVKNFVKERLNLPKEKADILILAGGGHEKFARYSGIKYEKNTLYEDKASPIIMDIETRKSETERYYREISLDINVAYQKCIDIGAKILYAPEGIENSIDNYKCFTYE